MRTVLRQLGLKTLSTDGGLRGMATGADIMCGRATPASQPPESSKLHAAESLRASHASASVTTASAAGAELPNVLVTPSTCSWAKQKWWRPDPATGTWVPEGHEGQVTTGAAGCADAIKSASRPVRVVVCRCDDSTASQLEEKRWWTSMEELPDMDRAK